MANASEHEDTILTKYLVVGLPAGCKANGVEGTGELFSDLSSYSARQKKTFTLLVVYECPNSLTGTPLPFQLRLIVDHDGDDYPLPDNEDDVPTNNDRQKSKFIK